MLASNQAVTPRHDRTHLATARGTPFPVLFTPALPPTAMQRLASQVSVGVVGLNDNRLRLIPVQAKSRTFSMS